MLEKRITIRMATCIMDYLSNFRLSCFCVKQDDSNAQFCLFSTTRVIWNELEVLFAHWSNLTK